MFSDWSTPIYQLAYSSGKIMNLPFTDGLKVPRDNSLDFLSGHSF